MFAVILPLIILLSSLALRYFIQHKREILSIFIRKKSAQSPYKCFIMSESDCSDAVITEYKVPNKAEANSLSRTKNKLNT